MKMQIITAKLIQKFREHLMETEKAGATIEKYIRDVTVFAAWLNGDIPDKHKVLEYKEILIKKYKTTSVNSVLSSLNAFFEYSDWFKLKVKSIKVQRPLFSDSTKELTKGEYEKLLDAARLKDNERLYLLMQTICVLGIRVSELKYVTVQAIDKMLAEIYCKGKTRTVLIPKNLCKLLKKYTVKNKIKNGPVFVTKTGQPLNRSNIWSDMKKLCKIAGVSRDKVFPHNLRHLFARTYYSIEKDIVRLADILGHSSINTTRIYTMETGEVHRLQMQRLGLLQCCTT